MSQPADMNDRVTRLENEVAQVRYLAVAANQDTSDFQRVVSGHTNVLNAIGETQREHGMTLTEHTRSFIRLDAKMDYLSSVVGRHGHMLDRLNAKVDHHSTVQGEHGQILDHHSRILDRHTATLERHSVVLDQHSVVLDQHSVVLDQHSVVLERHSVVLDSHTELLGKLRVGQEHITMLLTKALDLPDQATESGE